MRRSGRRKKNKKTKNSLRKGRKSKRGINEAPITGGERARDTS